MVGNNHGKGARDQVRNGVKKAPFVHKLRIKYVVETYCYDQIIGKSWGGGGRVDEARNEQGNGEGKRGALLFYYGRCSTEFGVRFQGRGNRIKGEGGKKRRGIVRILTQVPFDYYINSHVCHCKLVLIQRPKGERTLP